MGLIAKNFAVTKSAPITYSAPGRIGYSGSASNQATDESMLRYYSQVGLLRASIGLIAEAVAQNSWTLYRKKKDGTREEITGQHDLKDLINKPNPLQSGHDFFELHQIFIELIGRDYWKKEKQGGKGELWIASPQNVSAIPGGPLGISGYHYEKGEDKHDWKLDEVVAFIEPDPMNPLTGGSGRARAAGIDIEQLVYMAQHNRNYFMWGASMGEVITYPPEASISPADIDRLSQQFDAGHRSYGRAHKSIILTQGATIAHEGIGQRDMDFNNLYNTEQKALLGGLGVSYSMLGGTEAVARANADAQLLNFARWVTAPRLFKLRERMNMDVTPYYGADLELDYDNPIPEDTAVEAAIADNHMKAGGMSIEEYRQQLDLGEIDPEHHFMVPVNIQIVTGKDILDGLQSTPAIPNPPTTLPPGSDIPVKSKKKMFDSPESKDAFWKAFVKQAENYEPKTVKALNKMFDGQKAEAVKASKEAVSRNHKLLNLPEAKRSYIKTMTPLLTEVILNSVKQGHDLIDPENPHTESKAGPVNQIALAWLRSRITWAAESISNETEAILSKILQDGFEQGLSIDDIAKQIAEATAFSSIRAENIARTEILMASNEGAVQGYKDSGVITRVEWLTSRDDRTCPICEPMDGQVFAIDDFPTPPASSHPRCRCVGIPVID